MDQNQTENLPSFEELVQKAVKKIPKEFRKKFDNLVFFVEDFATSEQLQKQNIENPYNLLGLYEGIPFGKRGTAYSGYLPDKITIFQKPIEVRCPSFEELEQMVDDVVWHEVGHYLGMNEEEVRKMERERTKNRYSGF